MDMKESTRKSLNINIISRGSFTGTEHEYFCSIDTKYTRPHKKTSKCKTFRNMAKEKGEKRKRDEERKEKKVKRSDKHDDERKEDRKEKDKERSHKKKRRLTNGTDGDATAAAPVASEPAPPAVVESAPGTKAAADVRNGDAGDDNDKRNVKAPPPIGALVPFANPLADEKVQKKVLKSVSKGTTATSMMSYFLSHLSLYILVPFFPQLHFILPT